MAITYTTKITNIYCYPQYQSLTNLAFNVLWVYSGTDGTYESNIIGSTAIPFDPSAKYTPFEQLTEAEVIEWVQKYTDPTVMTDAETLISQRIADASAPPVAINPTLPWENV